MEQSISVGTERGLTGFFDVCLPTLSADRTVSEAARQILEEGSLIRRRLLLHFDIDVLQ